jgi:hypothetical protein
VARLAALLCEAAFVRITVTVIALREGKSEIARLVVRPRGVTFFALDLRVLASKRITGFGVIESSRDAFPSREIVALRAIRTEASVVWVLVARDAGFRYADKGSVEVFNSDQRALSGRNVFGAVALLAFHASMLAFQNVARLFMVESLLVPLYEGEIKAIVIRMALRALLAGARGDAI